MLSYFYATLSLDKSQKKKLFYLFSEINLVSSNCVKALAMVLVNKKKEH